MSCPGSPPVFADPWQCHPHALHPLRHPANPSSLPMKIPVTESIRQVGPCRQHAVETPPCCVEGAEEAKRSYHQPRHLCHPSLPAWCAHISYRTWLSGMQTGEAEAYLGEQKKGTDGAVNLEHLLRVRLCPDDHPRRQSCRSHAHFREEDTEAGSLSVWPKVAQVGGGKTRLGLSSRPRLQSVEAGAREV